MAKGCDWYKSFRLVDIPDNDPDISLVRCVIPRDPLKIEYILRANAGLIIGDKIERNNTKPDSNVFVSGEGWLARHQQRFERVWGHVPSDGCEDYKELEPDEYEEIWNFVGNLTLNRTTYMTVYGIALVDLGKRGSKKKAGIVSIINMAGPKGSIDEILASLSIQ